MAAVAFSVGRTQDADACNPATKVEYSPPKSLTDLIPLFGLTNMQPPPSCGDFDPGSLSSCQGDLLFERGCCDATCAAVSEAVSVECYDDLFAEVCKTLPGSVDLIGNLAARCKAGYVYKGCSAGGDAPGSTPGATAHPAVAAAPATGDPAPISADVEALAALEEGLNEVEPSGSAVGDVTEELFHRDAGSVAALCGTLVGVAALLAVVVA